MSESSAVSRQGSRQEADLDSRGMSGRSRKPAGASRIAALLALVAIAGSASLLLLRLTEGAEIADDAPRLLQLVRQPGILFTAAESQDLPTTWRSYPPLLPAAFGLAVRPGLAFLGDFGAIRFGALLWTGAALLAMAWLARRSEGLTPDEQRRALWAYALCPPTWAAVALIPQEESYVSLFVLALYAASRAGRPGLVAGLLVLSVLAGKLFLLALVVPLALYGPRPLRDLLAGGGGACAALALYLGYHALRFGEMPLVGYQLDAATAISAWSLLVELGLPLPPRGVQLGSALSTLLAVSAFALAARRRGLAPLHAVAGCLWILLLTLSIAMPPYVLWNLPLTAMALARLREAGQRRAALGLLFAWGAVAYGAKLLRGAQLALELDRGPGKRAVAAPLLDWLGSDFPYRDARTLAIALLVAGALAMVGLLWRTGHGRNA